MSTKLWAKRPRSVYFCLIVLGLLTAIFVLPFQFRTASAAKGLIQQTGTHDEGLPNYDIRTDKSSIARIAEFRSTAARSASDVADIRDQFVRGEEALKGRVPTLKVEYNEDIRTPEVIGPDVKQGRNFLTGDSAAKRSEILRSFVKENERLIGVSDGQAQILKVTADYTNPDGNMSFAHLEQRINDIPVFRGEVKAGFTKNGEMIRVINNLAPGLDYGSISTDFHSAEDAVRAAAGHINHTVRTDESKRNDAASTDLKAVFGSGDWATTAEKMYFPTEPGVAVPAWRVLIWEPVNAYYVIVDAASGTMLWRKNIGEDQTQGATYQVYANPNSMVNTADSPAALTPGPVDPTPGTQAVVGTRTNVTLIGNEIPNTFNNLGWITDGANITDGNNLEAGVDRVAPDGVDATQVGSPNRVFDSAWNPAPGSPAPGDAPLTTVAQRGAVIQMFYIMNRYHDEMYKLGFTEAAFNFQNDNFGRGGAQADRVSAQGQDSSGTNNANFNTPADGGRGRMQMYIWTGPNPDYDGTADGDIIIHEVTHGTSNRLHGNSAGLSTNMSRGMGEGWGDFYGHALLSEPTDPINGIYTTGGYATHLGAAGYTGNYYYGIRRFPKAVMAFTGGPNNRPHNPLTFADLNAGCNLTDGAFARGPFGVAQCDAVHNAGEIWSSALWEVRAKYVQRLTWAVGNKRILQHVLDGMKLAPIGPTFLQERDAILAGALATGTGADVADIWAGFAIRGMGFSSRVTAAGAPAVVVEAFDLPNLVQTPTLTVSDAPGDNDGFPEPGETLSISVPLTNSTGGPATGTTLQIVGGGSANYGTINNGQTVSQTASYTVPPGTQCGSSITLTFNVNSSLGATSFTGVIIIGVPQATFTQNFDGVTAPAFPAGWTAVSVQSGVNFVNSTLNADTAANSAFALDPLNVGGGTDLTSPSMPITASAATVSFRNRYDTEPGWDGGVLEISINGGGFQDVITAGGRFVENGYNGALGAGTNNPLANRNAWSGSSGGYITSTVQLPAAAAGQNVQLKWRFGADDNTAGTGPNSGWYVDTIRVNGTYACSVVDLVKSRADFDGDGRSDPSVFRPSEGNWYVNRSTAGFLGIHWGATGDVIVPGDYDGDNKADYAVWRPSDTPTTTDFYILNSNGFTFNGYAHGLTTDIPVPGDFDGDGKADIVVWRPSTGEWFLWTTIAQTTTSAQFGATGDIPMAMDKDADNKANLTVYRPSNNTFYMANATGTPATNFTSAQWGVAGDKVVTGDYDGDGKEDVAVWRPSDGVWYIVKSGGGTSFIQFGANGDIPVVGDYDGDGKDDQAVYRGGIWYMNRSTSGFAAVSFGTAADVPVPSKY